MRIWESGMEQVFVDTDSVETQAVSSVRRTSTGRNDGSNRADEDVMNIEEKWKVRGMTPIVVTDNFCLLHRESNDRYLIGHTKCPQSWCTCSSCTMAQMSDRCSMCGERYPEGLRFMLDLLRFK